MPGSAPPAGPISRRRFLARAALLPAALFPAALSPGRPAAAEEAEIRYLRLGTGTAGGTHFQMGGLLAGVLSNPPGGRPCDRGGSCGVPGVIVLAAATEGSAANAEALGTKRLDLALVEADVAQWAVQGKPPFDKPVADLRAVAHLYLDHIHLAARRDAGIATPRDLRGKRVSLGQRGSGTLAHARRLLAAWGMKESEIKAQYLGTAQAADGMAAGRLDAFFVMDWAPVPALAELARAQPLALVPLAGDGAARLRRDNGLLLAAEIPAGTYEGQAEAVPTLAVGVDLATAADLPDGLVYDLARSLWHPATLALLAAGPSHAPPLKPAEALTGLGLMLHPGALRYYRDAGMVE